MTHFVLNRRTLLAASGSVLAIATCGLLVPADAQGVAATASMSGGSNNYIKGAPTRMACSVWRCRRSFRSSASRMVTLPMTAATSKPSSCVQ